MRSQKVGGYNEKGLGQDEYKRTADSFVSYKTSASPAVEQLICQITADDLSLTGKLRESKE